jgi:hypothetical protein
MIACLDFAIAATALEHGVTVVTCSKMRDNSASITDIETVYRDTVRHSTDAARLSTSGILRCLRGVDNPVLNNALPTTTISEVSYAVG